MLARGIAIRVIFAAILPRFGGSQFHDEASSAPRFQLRRNEEDIPHFGLGMQVSVPENGGSRAPVGSRLSTLAAVRRVCRLYHPPRNELFHRSRLPGRFGRGGFSSRVVPVWNAGTGYISICSISGENKRDCLLHEDVCLFCSRLEGQTRCAGLLYPGARPCRPDAPQAPSCRSQRASVTASTLRPLWSRTRSGSFRFSQGDANRRVEAPYIHRPIFPRLFQRHINKPSAPATGSASIACGKVCSSCSSVLNCQP